MTRGRTCNRATLLLIPLAIATLGCVRGSAPLDLTSLDPAQDQWKIAGYHSREAVILRLKADELSQRVVVYERLFGHDSEWATGTRLLVQFYEDAAKEQERLAGLHLDIAGHGRPQFLGTASP